MPFSQLELGQLSAPSFPKLPAITLKIGLISRYSKTSLRATTQNCLPTMRHKNANLR
jgi:hypothetical protein